MPPTAMGVASGFDPAGATPDGSVTAPGPPPRGPAGAAPAPRPRAAPSSPPETGGGPPPRRPAGVVRRTDQACVMRPTLAGVMSFSAENLLPRRSWPYIGQSPAADADGPDCAATDAPMATAS